MPSSLTKFVRLIDTLTLFTMILDTRAPSFHPQSISVKYELKEEVTGSNATWAILDHLLTQLIWETKSLALSTLYMVKVYVTFDTLSK